eukprot:gene27486-36265_t
MANTTKGRQSLIGLQMRKKGGTAKEHFTELLNQPGTMGVDIEGCLPTQAVANIRVWRFYDGAGYSSSGVPFFVDDEVTVHTEALSQSNNSNSSSIEISEEEIVSLLYSYFSGQLVFKAQLGHFHHNGDVDEDRNEDEENLLINKMRAYSSVNNSDFDGTGNQSQEVIIHNLSMGAVKMLNYSRAIHLLNSMASVSNSYHPDFIMKEGNIQTLLYTMSEFIWDNYNTDEALVISKEMAPFSLFGAFYLQVMLNAKKTAHDPLLTMEMLAEVEKKINVCMTAEKERSVKFTKLEKKADDNERMLKKLEELASEQKSRSTRLTQERRVVENIVFNLIWAKSNLKKKAMKLAKKNAELEKENAELKKKIRS